MSAPAVSRPVRPSPLLVGTARTVAAGFAVLAGGLAAQLWRHDALLGGQVARRAFPQDERAWTVPHYVANGVSVAGGTVITPALLLGISAVISMRARRWRPLVGAVGVVVLADLCLAIGKTIGGNPAVSGPATMSIVCWGVAAWLLRDQLHPKILGSLHWGAGSAALVIGVAQLYLRHSLLALLLSWALGAGILVFSALVSRRTTASASPRHDHLG